MTREQILGEIQALRAEVERVESREHGRGIRSRLVSLRGRAGLWTGAVGPGTEAEAEERSSMRAILDGFEAEAREKITRALGTSAWDEPETVEEGMARMGTLPAAPGPGVLDRVNVRFERDETVVRYGAAAPPPLTDEEIDLAEREWSEAQRIPGMDDFDAVNAALPVFLRLVAEVRRRRSDAVLKDGAIERLKAGWSAANERIESMGRDTERLRSDEWLTAAAREIEEKSAGGCAVPLDEGLTILRKHRDGKA